MYALAPGVYDEIPICLSGHTYKRLDDGSIKIDQELVDALLKERYDCKKRHLNFERYFYERYDCKKRHLNLERYFYDRVLSDYKHCSEQYCWHCSATN